MCTRVRQVAATCMSSCPLLRTCTSTAAEETSARLHKSREQLTMVDTVQLTYPTVGRPPWHRWDVFTQVSKEHNFTQAPVGVSLGFVSCFLVLEWMHAYLSGCLLESEWMWSLYIIFILTVLCSVLVSASLEHRASHPCPWPCPPESWLSSMPLRVT